MLKELLPIVHCFNVDCTIKTYEQKTKVVKQSNIVYEIGYKDNVQISPKPCFFW